VSNYACIQALVTYTLFYMTCLICEHLYVYLGVYGSGESAHSRSGLKYMELTIIFQK